MVMIYHMPVYFEWMISLLLTTTHASGKSSDVFFIVLLLAPWFNVLLSFDTVIYAVIWQFIIGFFNNPSFLPICFFFSFCCSCSRMSLPVQKNITEIHK